MSRIGERPIEIPAGVEVVIGDANDVSVKGPKGQLRRQLHPEMEIKRDGSEVRVVRPSDERRHRSLHGLTRTLLANMIIGVTEGFERALELNGIGYRAAKTNNGLVLTVGFSHPVEIVAPEGISFAIEGNNKVSVGGIDKELVGQTAARIRSVRPPEPYKGKGIRDAGEHVRRKAGNSGKPTA